MAKHSYNKRYNVSKTFEYNKKNGPFESVRNHNKKINTLLKKAWIKTDFFGFETKLPLGVAAGPLYNMDYMKGAAFDGFSVITWKTFRSVDRLAHRSNGDYVGHNIVFVSPEELTTRDLNKKLKGNTTYNGDPQHVSITNSFGMPSFKPQAWMDEVTEIEAWMTKQDKLAITSVVGTPVPTGDIETLAHDYGFLGRCAESAGARIVEINLSCPNVKGKEGSIYKDPKNTALIAKRVRESFYNPDTKLLIKVGHADKTYYKKLLKAAAPHIDGVVAINTIPMEVVDDLGRQALPGGMKSGICGKAIIGLAAEAVANLVAARKELKLTHIKIIGCGGVMSAEDFMRHIDAGAEYVMCATAALFNPKLPLEVAQYIHDNKIKKTI